MIRNILIVTVVAIVTFTAIRSTEWVRGDMPLPMPAAFFNDGQGNGYGVEEHYYEAEHEEHVEGFWTLMHHGPHWQFEFVVSFVETLLFSFIIGGLAWPRIKRHIHKDVETAEQHDHDLIEALEARVKQLEDAR